jgi:hypothetical protein
MRPLLHPTLVNGRSGDPALYIETLFETRAILFGLGDISNLSNGLSTSLSRILISIISSVLGSSEAPHAMFGICRKSLM